MPGANCSIFGCGSSRRNKGISIFKIPTRKDKLNEDWRSKLVGQILKDREVDDNLRRQIASDTLHICERHFEKECIEICKYIL